MKSHASDAVRAALKGHDPTDEQWAAITHALEPLHLIAGAGAGKTAVMAARIVHIVESGGYSPSQVLGLTFTNKASEELLQRVRSAISHLPDHRPEDLTVQTYHAFAAGIVRDHGLRVGVEPEAGLLSNAQQWQLVLSCFNELPPFEAIELRSYAYLVRNALAMSSSVADHMITTAEVEASCDALLASPAASDPDVALAARQKKELCRAVAAYTEVKRRSQRIDFGDQVRKAVEILERFPDVTASYRERFPVILLDEYQDTNVAQRRLIQQLVTPGGAVTAVGDARQAIYAFRGATMYNLIGFPSHFLRADGRLYEPTSLSHNFRSGSQILDVANRVIDRIDPSRRPGLPLVPLPENGSGKVSLGLFGDQMTEARWIAARCDELHETRMVPDREPVAWRAIAILVRTKAHMDSILSALVERDIPTEVVDLGGLLKTPEVTEVVAWLRSLETKPGANRWLARIILGPRYRIHYRDLALCSRWAARRNHQLRIELAGGDESAARDVEAGDVAFALAEALGHLDEIEGLGSEARRRLAELASKIDGVRRKMAAPLLELVQTVIETSGIADALDSSRSRSAPAAKQNLANFLDHVANFSPLDGQATMRSFLAYLDAAEEAEDTLDATQPAEQDSVKLMTVHAAKGLEFECVFVPSVAAGKNDRTGDYKYSVFPNTRASDPLTSYTELPYDVREDAAFLPTWKPGDKIKDFNAKVKERGLEDERRLFYVALTRAKQWLGVSAAWWYGRGVWPKGPSLFWDELRPLVDEGLIELVSEVEQPADNPVIEELEQLRSWPPVAQPATDPLFPEGWAAAADALVSKTLSPGDLLERLDPTGRGEAEGALARHLEELETIGSTLRAEEPSSPQIPDVLSATSLVRLMSGDLTPWDLVRPLPDRPTRARRIGTEIHRLIEEKSRGISTYPDDGELDEPSKIEDGGVISDLLGHWRDSGFADRKLAQLPSGQPMIELPFALRLDGRIIRGRIDAVYETNDGGVEIVDFKTGRRFEPTKDDQLSIYAEALHANGLLTADAPIRLTYLFLDGKPPSTREWAPAGGRSR